MSTEKQQTKRRKRLPKKKVQRIRELVASGRRSITEVAELYDIPYFTAYSIVRGYSYTRVPGTVAARQRQFVSEERAARIVELHARGASVSQLALASKLSVSTIKRVLRRHREATQ